MNRPGWTGSVANFPVPNDSRLPGRYCLRGSPRHFRVVPSGVDLLENGFGKTSNIVVLGAQEALEELQSPPPLGGQIGVVATVSSGGIHLANAVA